MIERKDKNMIERKMEYILEKIGDGKMLSLIIDPEYLEFIQKLPYILRYVPMSYRNAVKLDITLDPRYDKDEAYEQLDKDIDKEVNSRSFNSHINSVYNEINKNVIKMLEADTPDPIKADPPSDIF